MEEGKKEKKSFFKTMLAFKYYSVIAIIVVVIFIIFLGVRISSKFATQEKTTKFGLEDVGELVTQTCYTTVLEDSKVNLEFFKLFDIPFTESRQIFSYDFEVDASINFDTVKINKIDDKNKVIEFGMPHASVYKTTLNPSSFRVYIDSDGLLTRIDLEQHNSAIQKMQEQAQNDCVSNGLLSSADGNAQQLIQGMIKSNSKYKDYKVNYAFLKD